jgi:hypothetical protein
MRFYADTPLRRIRQVIADLLVLCWLAASIVVGSSVGLVLYRIADGVAKAGRQTTSAARQLRSSADSVSGLPLVGSRVADPLRSLGNSLDSVGTGLNGDTASLHHAGVAYAIALSILASAVPVFAWCLTRARWIRRASAVRGPLSEDDLEALAYEATARSGLRTLRRLPPGTVVAWSAGNPRARRELAALRLAHLGLRPPLASSPL